MLRGISLGIALDPLRLGLMQLPVIRLHIHGRRQSCRAAHCSTKRSSSHLRQRLLDRIRGSQLVDLRRNGWHRYCRGRRTQRTGHSATQCTGCGMQGGAIRATFSPVVRFALQFSFLRRIGFFFDLLIQGVELARGVGADALGGFFAERFGDLGLRFYVLLQLLAVPGLLEGVAVVFVAAHSFVTGNAGDSGCGGAGCTAAVFAESDACAVQGAVAAAIAATGTKALALGLVVALVLDITGGKAGSGEAVLVVGDRLVRAGDLGAFQVGVAVDRDLEAVISRQNAALLRDALIVAVNLASGCVDTAGEAGADTDAAAQALLLALVLAGVLQAFNIEATVSIRADVGRDLLA